MKYHICFPRSRKGLRAEEGKLYRALKTLCGEIPNLRGTANDSAVTFAYSKLKDACAIQRNGTGYRITYNKAHHAMRMVGNLMSGILPDRPETCPFDTLGVMLDCSRNKVFTVDYLKGFFRKLAVLGYNMVMLYTENVYELDGEPYFGLMRGRYAADEIRELDDYADSLGMELVPCIQTLGHLEQMFRWPTYSEICDIGGVMLIDEEKSYRFIEKMIVKWKGLVRTRRIHIGMDEAWGIGRGRYRELHGECSKFEMLNRHLTRVNDLCKKHGLKPMMWSDMYFRLGSKLGQYYDRECVIPQDIVDGVPKDIQLVYWDYYHTDSDFYVDWIQRHRKLTPDTIVSTSVRTPCIAWYDHTSTKATVGPCLIACRAQNVREVLFTIWGDDGALCDFNSALAGLNFSAEVAYTGKSPTTRLEKRYNALFNGASYRDAIALANLTAYRDQRILWDDPLMLMFTGALLFAKEKYQDGIFTELKYDFETVLKGFERAAAQLKNAKDTVAGGSIPFARAYTDMILAKLTYAKCYLNAYRKSPTPNCVGKALPPLKDYRNKVRKFIPIVRKVWFSQAKPLGFETVQIRMAGQLARTEEAIVRLTDFCNGKAKTMPETEDLLKVADTLDLHWCGWSQISHGTVIV